MTPRVAHASARYGELQLAVPALRRLKPAAAR